MTLFLFLNHAADEIFQLLITRTAAHLRVQIMIPHRK